MLSFHELTQAEQAQRLHALAIGVLREHFGFDDISVRLVADHSFNTVFHVDADGDRFALRVGGAVRLHPIGIEDVEARWLGSLADGQITAPRNIAPCDIAGTGSARWVRFRHLGVPEARVCTLFTWVDGVGLGTRLGHRARIRQTCAAGGCLDVGNALGIAE